MADEPWEELCRAFLVAPQLQGPSARRLFGLAASNFPKETSPRWRWAIDALDDEWRKWFVAALLDHAKRVPNVMLGPMVRAAIHEPDLSRNQWFIRPCVGAFGRRVVLDVLLDAFEQGTDAEKSGGAAALYWLAPPDGPGWKYTREEPDDAPIDDARARMLTMFAREAAVTSNEQLRRRLARYLVPPSRKK
jgi:hypothetical protein